MKRKDPEDPRNKNRKSEKQNEEALETELVCYSFESHRTEKSRKESIISLSLMKTLLPTQILLLFTFPHLQGIWKPRRTLRLSFSVSHKRTQKGSIQWGDGEGERQVLFMLMALPRLHCQWPITSVCMYKNKNSSSAFLFH